MEFKNIIIITGQYLILIIAFEKYFIIFVSLQYKVYEISSIFGI